MLFIQCHFLHLDSLLQFHHLVCKLQEQKMINNNNNKQIQTVQMPICL